MAGKFFEVAFRIGGALTASFDKSMLTASGRVAKLTAESQQLGKQRTAIQRMRELQGQVDTAEGAFARAHTEAERLRRELAGTAKPTAKMRNELARAEKAVDRAADAVGKKKTALGKAEQAMRDAGVAAGNLTEIERRLTRETERLQRRQEALARVAGLKLGERFQRVGTSARSFGRDLGRLSLLASGVGAALGAVVKSTADSGDSAAKLGRNLGISAEAVQELRYAAERSGVGTAQMDKALLKLNQRVGEAAAGSTEARQGFEELGLAGADLAGKSPDEVLGLVADRMAALPDEAARASAANRLFGRSGVELVGVLGKGGAALQQLRADARATGNVMSNESAAGAEVMTDALLDARKSIAGVKNTLGAELLPVATSVLRQFSAYVRDNREQIQGWATQIADRVREAIPKVKTVIANLGELIGKIIDGARWLADFAGGWGNLAAILVGLRFAPLIASVVRVGSGLVKATHALGGFLDAAGGGAGKLAGLTNSVKGLGAALGKKGLVGAAGAAGYALGTLLTDMLPKALGAKHGLGEWLGDTIAGGDDREVTRAAAAARDKAQLAAQLLSGDNLDAARLEEAISAYNATVTEVQEAGGKLSTRFDLVAAIRAGEPEAIAAIRDVMERVDEYLPHSDAKRGPLSRLSDSGRSIPLTIAEGARSAGTAGGAGVGQGLGGLAPRPGSLAPRPGSLAPRPGSLAPRPGAALTLNLTQNITTHGGAEASTSLRQAAADIAAQVETAVRRLLSDQRRLDYGV